MLVVFVDSRGREQTFRPLPNLGLTFHVSRTHIRLQPRCWSHSDHCLQAWLRLLQVLAGCPLAGYLWGDRYIVIPYLQKGSCSYNLFPGPATLHIPVAVMQQRALLAVCTTGKRITPSDTSNSLTVSRLRRRLIFWSFYSISAVFTAIFCSPINARDNATAPVLLHSIFQPSGSSHIPTLHCLMQDTANATRNKASALQDLIDKVVQGGLSKEDITSRCRTLGVSLVEFKDVLAEAEHCKRVRFGKSRVDDDLEDAGSSSSDQSPNAARSGSATLHSQPPITDSIKANDEVARQLLCAKLRVVSQLSQPTSSQDIADLLDLSEHDDDA